MGIQDFIEIVQGEDRVLSLTFADDDGNRFDLTTATEIVASFGQDDGTALTKQLTDIVVIQPPSTTPGGIVLVSGPGGQITVDLTSTDTASLKAVDRGDFEVVITLPTGDRIVQFLDKLTVRAQLF